MKLVLLAIGAFIASLAGTAVTVMMVSEPEPVSAPARAESEEPATGDDEQVTGDSAVADTASVSHDSSGTAVADSVADLTEATDTSQAVQGEAMPEDDSAPSDSASTDSSAVDPPVDVPAPAIPPPGLPASLPGSTMPVAIDIDSAAEEESARQTARIFSAMRAPNAAAVFVHLSDDEIVGILRFFNARKAAAVLSEFPDERAASVSRALLGRGGAGGGNQ